MRATTQVLVLKQDRELRWRDFRNPLFALFFRGSHWYVLEPLPGGRTRFVHGAEMLGLAIPFLWATMRATRAGYKRFNAALADEVMARAKRQVGRQRVVATS